MAKFGERNDKIDLTTMHHLVLFPLKLLAKPPIFILVIVCLLLFFGSSFLAVQNQQVSKNFQSKIADYTTKESTLKEQLTAVEKELTDLKNEDQVKKNKDLESAIKLIEETYKKSVLTYEKILDFKGTASKKTKFDEGYAKSVKLLTDRNYVEAGKVLDDINKQLDEEQEKAAAAAVPTVATNVPINNTPPVVGYARQKVNAGIGEYTVDLISADLGSTRVIVDTASDSDCRDNCPVLGLGDYVSRNGAFAGVNGSYFCPAAYPQCAGKTNSFDTLLMNKNKIYFNSDNNVYSSVPAAIFSAGNARFVGASSQWGRDTSVDSVIANYPLLITGGNINFGGSGDPKQGSKGARSFIGTKGSTVYIGVVHNATVAEVAHVLKAMGLQEALNLDSGGSTALWSGGYKVGPGRSIPNAVLFIRR